MLSVFAEFERDLIAERRAEGIRLYQERLAKDGRKPGREPHGQDAKIKTMRKKGKMIREIMAATGLSKASVYRALGS